VLRTIAQGGDDRHRLVAVIAKDPDHRELHHLGELLGDGREHFGRRGAPRHQRGHASQRRLLLCKPPELDAIPHVRVRHNLERASKRADKLRRRAHGATVSNAGVTFGDAAVTCGDLQSRNASRARAPSDTTRTVVGHV
jgi:hypothetical protein